MPALAHGTNDAEKTMRQHRRRLVSDAAGGGDRAACYGFTSIFGSGAADPVILSALAVLLGLTLFARGPSRDLIDGEALLDTAVASLVAGIVVALTASLAIYGFATASELRRADRDLAAIGAGNIAVAASLAFTAIVLDLIVMIDG